MCRFSNLAAESSVCVKKRWLSQCPEPLGWSGLRLQRYTYGHCQEPFCSAPVPKFSLNSPPRNGWMRSSGSVAEASMLRRDGWCYSRGLRVRPRIRPSLRRCTILCCSGAVRARAARWTRSTSRASTRICSHDRRPQAPLARVSAVDGRHRHGRLAGPTLRVAGPVSRPGSRHLASPARGRSLSAR